jgi:drug/metabolite transporter (DMT)-like permease
MSRRAWIAFAAVSLIWGIPYLFVKLAVRGGVPPLPLAFARVALGSLLLLALARRRGTLGDLRGRWRWLAAYALAEVVGPFPLIAFGEEHIASSLAAIVIAAVPLIGAILALRFDHSERVAGPRAVGLLVGFAGVIALVGVDTGGRGALLGTGAVLLAAVGYAIGPMIVKLRLAGIDPPAAMGASLALAAVMLAPGAAVTLPARAPSAEGLASVAVLGVICTALAFVMFAILIGEAGTGRATVITYVNPVIAVTLGVLLLGERPQAGAIAGLLLILAGSWLATGGRPPWNGRSPRFPWRERPQEAESWGVGLGTIDPAPPPGA